MAAAAAAAAVEAGAAAAAAAASVAPAVAARDDSIDPDAFAQFYERVIEPVVLRDIHPSEVAHARAYGVADALFNETLRLAARHMAKTFGVLFMATVADTTIESVRFRIEYKHLQDVMADIRFRRDPYSQAQRDLLSEVPVAKGFAADPVVRQRVFTQRLHLPSLGVIDDARLKQQAIAQTNAENFSLARRACFAYASAVRNYTGYEHSLMGVPVPERLITLGESPAEIPNVTPEILPQLSAPPYTDPMYERPSWTDELRKALTELSRVSGDRDRAARYTKLLAEVAQVHSACQAARLAAYATLQAGIQAYVNAWISIRASGAVHAQLVRESKLIERATKYTHTYPPLAVMGQHLRDIVRTLTVAEVDHRETINQMKRCIPTNIVELWGNYCRKLVAFYDAETMTRDIDLILAGQKQNEWSTVSVATGIANHGAKLRSEFVARIAGPVPLGLMKPGLEAIRVATASGAKLWNNFWTLDVPAQTQRLSQDVIAAEGLLASVRVVDRSHTPALFRAREWLQGYSEFCVSGRQSCHVPSARVVKSDHLFVGDTISAVAVPGGPTDLISNGSAVQYALVVFACGQKKKQQQQQKQQQKAAPEDQKDASFG